MLAFSHATSVVRLTVGSVGCSVDRFGPDLNIYGPQFGGHMPP